MTINDSVKGIRAMAEMAVAAGLSAAGRALKESTRGRQSSGLGDSRLTKSIDYLVTGPRVTSSYVGQIPTNTVKVDSDTDHPRDKLPQPSEPLSLVFGAGAPYAGYVERGTAGPYTGQVGNVTPEDGTFREKIKTWASERGMDEDAAFRIANKIWATGTEAKPFMPTEAAIGDTIHDALSTANRAVFSSIQLPPLVFKVGSK